jgi:hypothetical protein
VFAINEPDGERLWDIIAAAESSRQQPAGGQARRVLAATFGRS